MSSSKARPSKPSIMAHRWFPKFVGFWFAALFGLCSLAVAPEVLERIVTTLGIERIVPAAAPPLGETARLLLAMGMAGVGEIAGLVIGGWLAASRQRSKIGPRSDEPDERDAADPIVMPSVRARDRHADAPPRKPLSAIDDLGGNTRAVLLPDCASVADHEPRPLAELAPLRGDEWVPSEIAEPASRTGIAPEGSQYFHSDSLDLAMYEPSPEKPGVPPSVPGCDRDNPAAVSGALIEPENAPIAIASAPLEALGVVQLSERLALALQARRQRRAQGLATTAALAPEVVANPDDVAQEESADEIAEGGYSSLLAMGSSLPRPDPLRIEEPHSDAVEPVVIFPGHGPRAGGDFTAPATAADGSAEPAAASLQADPAETGRALRAALASLQRISGAR